MDGLNPVAFMTDLNGTGLSVFLLGARERFGIPRRAATRGGLPPGRPSFDRARLKDGRFSEPSLPPSRNRAGRRKGRGEESGGFWEECRGRRGELGKAGLGAERVEGGRG